MTMNKLTTSVLLMALVAVPASSAFAGKLPKGAVPLSADEIKSLYADHTAVWSPKNQAYFAADGTVKGVGGESYFAGKWPIDANKICMEVQATNSKTKKSDGKTYSDCWQWVKVGTTTWTLYSKSYDNKKLDLVNGWYHESDKLKSGDLVSAKYSAMGGQ